MQKDLDLLGAIVAYVVFISSIITFASRMIFKLQPGLGEDGQLSTSNSIEGYS